MYEDFFNRYDASLTKNIYSAQVDRIKYYINVPRLLDSGNYERQYLIVKKGTRIWLTGRYRKFGQTDRFIQSVDADGNHGYIMGAQISAGEWSYYSTEGNNPSITSYKDSEIMVNSLIDNNKTILENNLLCAGLITELEKQGKDMSAAKRKVMLLQRRLEERDNAIFASNKFEKVTTATPIGFIRYKNNLQDIADKTAIGAPPIVVAIVVSVVFTILTMALLYKTFKPHYSESKADLKVSKELTELLANVDPEVRAKILADLEEQVDKAYIRGKMDGSGVGTIKTLTYMGAGILGFMLLSNLFNVQNRKQ